MRHLRGAPAVAATGRRSALVPLFVLLVLGALLVPAGPLTAGTMQERGATVAGQAVGGRSLNGATSDGQRTAAPPWMAAIVGAGGAQVRCGGTVVAEGWVLTAGHCVADVAAGRLGVVVGTDRPADVPAVAVDEIVLHPAFRPDATRADLALLRLAAPVGSPVTLPAADGLPPDPGAAVRLLGWGATDAGGEDFPEALRTVDLRVVADAVCGDVASAAVRICAGAAGAGACTGDSGGPLVTDPGTVQIGVLSAGTDPCGAGQPDEYVELGTYVPWIAAVTRGGAPLAGTVPTTHLGGDTTDVAVQLSRLGYAADHPIAFVATQDAFPDGLAGGALAAGIGPLLLTPSDRVPAAVLEELTRLSPARIIVFGGPAAVNPEAQVQLETVAPVERIAGDDRYETAAGVAAAWPGMVRRVFVATGADFPDALAAVPAASGDGPVLLSQPGTLPEVTRRQIQRLAPDEIVLLGGTAALEERVEQQLAAIAPTRRVAGEDRYATAAAVATDRTAFDAPPYVFVTTGRSFADALVAGVAAARVGSPLLLADAGRTDALRAAVPALHPDRVIAVGTDERLPRDAVEAIRHR